MPYIKVDPADMPVLPPEPWLFSPESGGILDAEGNVAILGEMLNLTGNRVVACVNACQGVPTEALAEINITMKRLRYVRKFWFTHDMTPGAIIGIFRGDFHDDVLKEAANAPES